MAGPCPNRRSGCRSGCCPRPQPSGPAHALARPAAADWPALAAAFCGFKRKGSLAVNLLPAELRPRKSRWEWVPTYALAALNLLLLLALLLQGPVQQRAWSQRMSRERERLEPAVSAFRKLEAERDLWRERAGLLDRHRHRNPHLLAALAELSLVLPADAVVTLLTLREGQLRIQGTSGQAAALPRILEDSRHFGQVELVSSISRNSKGRETFHLQARLEEPTGPAEPSAASRRRAGFPPGGGPMTRLSSRERTLLVWGGLALALYLLLDLAVLPYWDSLGETRANAEFQARRVRNYRRMLQRQDRTQSELDQLQRRTESLEQGLLDSPGDALAGAEIQGLVRDIAAAQGLTIRNSALAPVEPLGPHYSKVSTRINLSGGIHQWVDFVAAMGSGSRILFVEDLRIAPIRANDPKNKDIRVTLSVAALKRAEPKEDGKGPAAAAGPGPKGGAS